VPLIVALLVCGFAPARAQTFYVDNQSLGASTAGPGTELQPYSTIMSAATAHKGAGITILVKPGIYREQVGVPASGADGAPYVFQALGPGVIVDGSDDLSGVARWATTATSAFLAAEVNWTPNQVFVDGARLAKATSADAMPTGSFFYLAGTGLFVNLGGDNPGAHDVAASRRNYGFTMSTKSFVTVDGFEVRRTNDRGLNLFESNDVVIAHNTVSFTNSYGIQAVGCQRVRIEGNITTDANFHGIGLTASTNNQSTGCTVIGNESARNAHPTTRQANGIYLLNSPGNTLSGNRLHHNQDTGEHFGPGSNDCVSTNNISWANGDHGYDHLGTSNTIHVNDVAYGNHMDGFSFEGSSPGSQLYNSIAIENGLTTNEYDLWVDASSSVGFVSDRNIFWNSTLQPPIKFGSTVYSSLATYQADSGQDAHSMQADPLFVNPAAGDFMLGLGSPAIDAATSAVAFWPVTDALGGARIDDPRTTDTGVGPITYGDLGALEYVPLDVPPVVTCPDRILIATGSSVSFQVSASDPDGDPITSLEMSYGNLPRGSSIPTFVVNADHTLGTFSWTPPAKNGTYNITFTASNTLVGSATTQIQVRKRLNNGQATGAEGAFPGALSLSNGFPNPSAGAVDFALSLPEDAQVDWAVFDMQGRRVWSESGVMSAGPARLHWSGVDATGRRVANGLYLVRVRVGDEEFTRRVVRF